MSSLLKGILSKNNFPLEANKAFHNNTQPQENTINFFCRNHSKKPIVFICTAKDCENNLLCAACVLDSPSLLIKYKDHIYTLQDYFEGSKNKILQVKIDKEFQSLRKRVTDVLEVSKDDIKRSFSGGNSTENPNFAHIEKKLTEASFLNSKEETLDKENLQKFIKDAGKYEELERKSYENGGCKGASALETRYFEFLVKIKSQVDSFCRNVQKQTSGFVDIVRELENISEQRDLIETRRTATTNLNEVSMSVDAANHKRRLETSYNNTSHNRSVMVTQEESSFVLNTEARESVREHAGNAKHHHHQHQLKSILTNLAKNTSDNTTNPSSNSISPSYLPKPVPRHGLKLVKDFPTSNNPSIKDALAKHGPFRHENYSAANNNSDSSSVKRQRYGPIALENGDVYEGEWVEDRREGYGRLISVAGFFFDGFWKDNVAHGRGRLININGDMYEGDWENGKYHGRGTFIGVNGYQYTGDWSQDMQHGSGSEYWPDGSCYEGEYKLSKKHGKGVFKWANGEKYTGEFSLNNMHGNGVYEWPNGQKYYGYWAENKIMGEGRLEEPKAASQKMGEWDKKVLLSPDCALYKRELKSKGGEDLTVDPRYRFN